VPIPRWRFRISVIEEWFKRPFNGKKEENEKRSLLAHGNKSTRNQRYRRASATEAAQEGGGRDGDDGTGFVDPVRVGADDTTRIGAKPLSSASNRARVSARYVARPMSHLASHSESTVM